MTGKILPTDPSRPLPPPKWGLTWSQWERVNRLAWEYEHNGPLREFPGATLDDLFHTNRRLLFAKYLVLTGRLSE